MGLDSEPFLKPIGRANSIRGQPKSAPCCQPIKEIRCTESQGNRGIWDACSEFAWNSLGTRNSLEIRSENGLEQPCNGTLQPKKKDIRTLATGTRCSSDLKDFCANLCPGFILRATTRLPQRHPHIRDMAYHMGSWPFQYEELGVIPLPLTCRLEVGHNWGQGSASKFTTFS